MRKKRFEKESVKMENVKTKVKEKNMAPRSARCEKKRIEKEILKMENVKTKIKEKHCPEERAAVRKNVE